jgi:hypothetical protein
VSSFRVNVEYHAVIVESHDDIIVPSSRVIVEYHDDIIVPSSRVILEYNRG